MSSVASGATADVASPAEPQPFYFNTSAHLLRIGRERATTLSELLQALRTCSENSIFQHTFRTLQEHHFIREGFSNDFAHWTFTACNERGLAERLAGIDVREFTSVQAVREQLVQIVEEYIQNEPRSGDLSNPNRDVWGFLRPMIEQFDAAIFSQPSFARPSGTDLFRGWLPVDAVVSRHTPPAALYGMVVHDQPCAHWWVWNRPLRKFRSQIYRKSSRPGWLPVVFSIYRIHRREMYSQRVLAVFWLQAELTMTLEMKASGKDSRKARSVYSPAWIGCDSSAQSIATWPTWESVG